MPLMLADDEASLLRRRNLRDLGGLPTRDGFVIATGRWFRSSSPSRFGSAERRALLTLDLRCAIDLRMSAEIAQDAPSAFPSTFRVVHVPLFENARPNWIAPSDQTPRATAGRYLEMLEDGRTALAAVVAAVAQPGAMPVVMSCSAGRDRTGIVIACFLDLLDVTDDAIAMDYACSDSFDPESGRAHAATMHELLALIRARFGSTERMLVLQGVAPTSIDALRRELRVRS